MSFIAHALGLRPERQRPQLVPSDKIVPLHLFDDTSYLRPYTLMWTFRFDDVLDGDLLASSLSELFQSEGWCKLGGRLRLRDDGKIEVHIPNPFTADRPPLYFTKQHYDISMAEHPEAKHLPLAGDAPTLFPSPRHYASLALGPGAPTKLDDYLYSDLPQFALHVVTFDDGTLVSINFSHISSDVSGLRCILDAWQQHLAGMPERKAEFMSVRDGMGPLYEAAGAPEPQLIAPLRLSGWRMAAWALRFLWDSWWIPYESRLTCVPKAAMDKLVQNGRDDLADKAVAGGDRADQGDGQGGFDIPFITEGDVLLALSIRLAAYNLPAGSTRSITKLIAVDPRGRVGSVFRSGAAYVQNAPCGVLITTTAHLALTTSLGELALHARRCIQAQTTEAQLRASAVVLADALKNTGNLPMYGDASGYFATSSNWGKGKLLESIDFSRAITKPASPDRRQQESAWQPGRPVYYHSRNFEIKGPFSTSVFIIMGRDHEGNMWLTGDYPDGTWRELLEIINAQ